MISKLKTALYELRIRFAPHLGKYMPSGFKRILKRFIRPPVRKVDKLPYEAGFYPGGINLIGYLKARMGLGQGARLYAKAVEASGLPHVFLNTTAGNASIHHDDEFRGDLDHHAVYNTNIIHVNAEQMPLLNASWPAATWDRRYNIGVWLWELEEFPEEWRDSFRFLDEIWTPSTFTSRAIASVSPIPVTTIPYGISVETDPACSRASFGLPSDRFLFLTMYDVKSVMARKNPLGAIAAFKQAFRPDDNRVGLVVKVNNANSEDLDILQKHIVGMTHVYLINRTLSKPAVNSLIQSCDALVSLHRSEGFGLVIAEAMALGVPAIATNWSANTDFMDESNSCPVRYQLVDTGDHYYLSKAGQRWADPDISHAADHMCRLLEDPEHCRRIAQNGQQSIRTFFSIEKSAEKMRARLTELGLIP